MFLKMSGWTIARLPPPVVAGLFHEICKIKQCHSLINFEVCLFGQRWCSPQLSNFFTGSKITCLSSEEVGLCTLVNFL